ncbi:hypothetical protein KUCAC02_002437 [Chaenocephalus aceratus]|uniref:Uncharacterized protein n=1 Tax=Chaenocephalus aceratus TaxID=36190 RepID=A0ACB9XTK8_CHAAC|nr:hypothetical protein KUCAC02_002437 [Chaenocephalus aceratus]
MDLNLLLIMAAAGLCAVSSHTVLHRQYHFVNEAKNMSEAQIYCREKYTDLATVDSMEDVTLLNKIAGKYNQSAWIGLYVDWDSWRWLLPDTTFYKPGETEFRNWISGNPLHEVEKTCTLMSRYDGYWYNEVCPRPIKAACVDVQGPNVTFDVSLGSMSWTDAQSYCRTKQTDLAILRNLEENQQILGMITGVEHAWIALNRESWKWSDGSNSSLRYWAEAEPTEHVAPVTMQVIKLRFKTSNPDVDPNDPAFQEEMLVKMKKELRDKGLDDNIQLAWRKQPDGQVFQKEENERDEL